MSDTVIEARTARSKADEWTQRIAAQQRRGISVKLFCKENGLTECSFYAWRKRLRNIQPVRFALIERSAVRETETPLELVFPTGERLRISSGVDTATLRTVVEAMRA